MSESHEEKYEKDTVLMVGIYTDENHVEILDRIALRLKLCREVGCFNGCWEIDGEGRKVLNVRFMTDGKLRKVFIGKYSETSSTKVPSVAKFAVWSLWKTLGQSPIPGSMLEDRVVMDDVYSYIHHFFFDLCKLKTNSATSPLTRLEQLEAKLEDLIAINQPDGMAQESKRQKI